MAQKCADLGFVGLGTVEHQLDAAILDTMSEMCRVGTDMVLCAALSIDEPTRVSMQTPLTLPLIKLLCRWQVLARTRLSVFLVLLLFSPVGRCWVILRSVIKL